MTGPVRGLACPGCATPLATERRWLGLVRRYPSRCPSCGVKLGYTTTGEVVVTDVEPPT